VETADGQVVLIQRSNEVGECAGMVVCPGGHPEPKAVQMERPAAEAEQKTWENAVRSQLWDSILNEVVEETGIPKNQLDQPVCIGVVRRVVNHRPNMMFVIRCRLSAEQVQHMYRDASDKFESTGIFFLDRRALVEQALDACSLRMPGCHRGGVQLYADYLDFHEEMQLYAAGCQLGEENNSNSL